jgi:hypothetical protein
MLDALCRRNQARIFDFVIAFFLDHLGTFGDNTLHALAFRSPARRLVAGQNLLQTLRVPFSLLKVFLKTSSKLLVARSFRHFRHCFYELPLCAKKIFQLMNVEVFESLKFHSWSVRF